MDTDSFDRKIMLWGAGISGVIWLTYGNTPEDTEKIFQYIASITGYNFYIQPGYDVPSVYPLIALLWILVFSVNTIMIYYKANNSDFLYVPGASHPLPCIASSLNTTGMFAKIRTDGVKAFALQGPNMAINFKSHVHRVGPNNIIFEAPVIHETNLGDVPLPQQQDINNQTGGIFGVDTCSIGFFTEAEEQNHPYYNESLFVKGSKNILNTQTFLDKIRDLTFTTSGIYQIFRGEGHTASTTYIENIGKIGEKIANKPTTAIQRLFGKT